MLTISNVETLVGGCACRHRHFGAAISVPRAAIDLGSGNDKLTLADATNTGSISNVETLIGGTGADTITVSTQLSKGSIDLGDGTDKLTLGTAANLVTVSNVESIVGGSNADTITLATVLTTSG